MTLANIFDLNDSQKATLLKESGIQEDVNTIRRYLEEVNRLVYNSTANNADNLGEVIGILAQTIMKIEKL